VDFRRAEGRDLPGAGTLRRDVPRPMKVAVVSRVRLYREGLVLVLGTVCGIEVVGSAGDGPEAVDLLAAARPAVAIVDAFLVTAPALLPSLRQAHPAVRVVAFGVREDPTEIISCAEAGVSGYVSSEAGAADLVSVLEAVERDELSCTPFVASTLLKRVTELAGSRPSANGSAARPDATVLTSREAEVMSLIEQGLMNKQIARRLGISLSTVKNHVHRILQKEAVFSRGDLTRRHHL
jgi:two-component system nitrate/nitrite response regulator NarL